MEGTAKQFFLFALSVGVFFTLAFRFDPVFGREKSQSNKQADKAGMTLETYRNSQDSLIDVWNQDRILVEVERSKLEQIEYFVNVEDVPEIYAKWDRIHFYHDNGELLRVKTYPHQGNGDRSEEFYYKNNSLYMVVIEEHGADLIGRSSSFEGRRYYFKSGELFFQSNDSGEDRFTEKGEAESKLVEEGKKYQVLFQKIIEQ